MRSLILSALLLASAFQTALGQTYTSGDFTYTVSNNQATITGYSGAGGAVVIPGSVNSYPVVSIGTYAFLNCTALTSITIPNNVTSIGSGAFVGCTALASVTIPYTVTVIGFNAFNQCYRLASVNIPYGVTSIESNAFSYCTALASVTIPNSVTSIGSGAFVGCYGLGSVFIPSTLASQISQAGFLSTTIFYVGTVGAPTSMATQAQLATTQAQLATTQANLAKTKTDLTSYFAKFPNFIKVYLPGSIWSK